MVQRLEISGHALETQLSPDFNLEHEVGKLLPQLQQTFWKIDGTFFARTAANGYCNQEPEPLRLPLPPSFTRFIKPVTENWKDKETELVDPSTRAYVLCCFGDQMAKVVETKDATPVIYIPFSTTRPLTPERAARVLMAINEQAVLELSQNQKEKEALERRIQQINEENTSLTNVSLMY